MKKLRKLWRLPIAYQWLLLVTVLLLAIIRIGLWLLPCRYWLRLSSRSVPLPPTAFFSLRREPGFSKQQRTHPTYPQPGQEISLFNWSIRVVSRLMPGQVKCLARALTMHRLMVWYGYDPSLRIGVAHTAEGAFEAHAWITHDGIVVIGNLPDLERYTLLPSLQNLQNSPL